MTHEDFDILTKQLFDGCYKLLCKKQREYAIADPDRLCQFKQLAAFTGETPEKVLLGMLLKHWQSIMLLVRTVGTVADLEIHKWDEKLMDNINYSALLYALVVERKEAEIAAQAQEK